MRNHFEPFDEALAAEFVLTEEEVYQEFREQCEKAAENYLINPLELQQIAKALYACGQGMMTAELKERWVKFSTKMDHRSSRKVV